MTSPYDPPAADPTPDPLPVNFRLTLHARLGALPQPVAWGTFADTVRDVFRTPGVVGSYMEFTVALRKARAEFMGDDPVPDADLRALIPDLVRCRPVV
jgi:hypothetical protein